MIALVLLLGGLYCAAILLIALRARSGSETPLEFFAAGRSAGSWTLGLAVAASGLSGFVLVGGPGIHFSFGFGAAMLIVPVTTAFAIAWIVLGKRLRLLAVARPVITIPDVIHVRYGSQPARALAAIAILVGSVGYLTTQALVVGLVLGFLLDVPASLGAAIGTLVLALYTGIGGMRGTLHTDILQGLLMLAVSLILVTLALVNGGGLATMIREIAGNKPEWVAPFETLGPGLVIGWYMVFSLGVLGQPHILHKFVMARNVRVLRWSGLIACFFAMGICLSWPVVGTAVRALVEGGALNVKDPDQVATTWLLSNSSGWLAALFLVAVAAAAMSTADSLLLMCAAALVRDLPLAVGAHPSDAAQVRFGRHVHYGLCLATGAVAIVYGDLAAMLGVLGWSLFAAALAPSLGLGLNWTRATPAAAVTSISVGIALSLILELNSQFLWFKPLLPGYVYRGAAVFAISFICFVFVSLSTSPRKLEDDLAAVMRA